MTTIISMCRIASILLFMSSICMGSGVAVEEKTQEIVGRLSRGMSRPEVEATLRKLGTTDPNYLPRRALVRLYGDEWAHSHPDVEGRLFATIEKVDSHIITVTDLSIEIDIDADNKMSEVRVKAVEVGP